MLSCAELPLNTEEQSTLTHVLMYICVLHVTQESVCVEGTLSKKVGINEAYHLHSNYHQRYTDIIWMSSLSFPLPSSSE